MIYLVLFSVAFLSATLLPLGSEALLLYDATLGHSLCLLWAVASLGNTLGSTVNYWLGYRGEVFLEKRGYLEPEKVMRAKGYFDRYGGAALLLSWVPIIGDPITFVAGILRYPAWRFLFIVLVAKSMRYAVLLLFAQNAGIVQ